MTALLAERSHVDPSDLRGDLFPRHYTGISTFEVSQEAKTPSPSVNVDESWNQTFPVSERREDAWLR